MKIKLKLLDISAFLFCLVFFVAGTVISLNRFWQYEVSYIDFGQYDQSIWKASRFQEPIVYHFIHGRINVFGDHLTPSIFLISPLYWFTDKSEMILIVQAFAVAASGWVLYGIAKSILKNKLLSLSVLISYFLFVGLQNAVITEFHELTVMTLPLMLTLWAIIKNRIALYFTFLIITLGFKEITFALGIGIGIALLLFKKEWIKIGIATILISSAWGILAFKVIMPYFANGQYLYASSLPKNYLDMAFAFIDHPLKKRTLLFSFFSFSFLPFFAPQFWLAIIQDYASRFLPQNFTTRWDLGMHYNAQSAVLLAVSSIFGLKYLLKFSLFKKYSAVISIILILNSFVLFRFILKGPFMLFINPAFYTHTKEFDFINNIVKKVPKDASIMTLNNLATRFTHQDVRLLTLDYTITRPDYILVDMREGQSANNFTGSGKIKQIFPQLLKDPGYKIIYKTKEQFLFKKI